MSSTEDPLNQSNLTRFNEFKTEISTVMENFTHSLNAVRCHAWWIVTIWGFFAATLTIEEKSITLAHTRTHARTHAHAHVRTNAHTHTHTRARAYVDVDVRTHAHTYVHSAPASLYR